MDYNEYQKYQKQSRRVYHIQRVVIVIRSSSYSCHGYTLTTVTTVIQKVDQTALVGDLTSLSLQVQDFVEKTLLGVATEREYL